MCLPRRALGMGKVKESGGIFSPCLQIALLGYAGGEVLLYKNPCFLAMPRSKSLLKGVAGDLTPRNVLCYTYKPEGSIC